LLARRVSKLCQETLFHDINAATNAIAILSDMNFDIVDDTCQGKSVYDNGVLGAELEAMIYDKIPDAVRLS
jgi:hypothetical protein